MAKATAESFARFLTEAVYQIRHRESKSVQAVQDDLGYALGKKGGSSIEYWRKGFVPAKVADVEKLTRLLVQQGGFSRQWAKSFLVSARYPHPDQFLNKLFQTSDQTIVVDAQKSHTVTPKPKLPTQPTPFVGRQAELAEIQVKLQDPVCRILTLVGPGGVGKTRLALQAAEETTVSFPDGVFFTPLATLTSPEFLLSTIANGIDHSFVDEIPQQTQLINYLRDKNLLLIMDNFEHLMMEAQLVADIISQAPQVQILLTSRERLNLHGEWVFEVSGMTFPTKKSAGILPDPSEGESFSQYSAIQLFLQSARRVRSDFVLQETEKPAVIEICQLVDGFPLAIELAATWVRLLNCTEIAAEIARNYEFLATNWRDIPPRHRSLRAVFDYSWLLLSPEEQDVLCRLAVFQGGFHFADATAVTHASYFLLAQLADKSFLQGQLTGGETAVSRYEMHELLRLFALEKLNQSVSVQIDDQHFSEKMIAALDAHARHFAHFLHERNPQLKRPLQAEILAEIGQEMDNIRAAWHWLLQREQIDLIQIACDSLFHFYDIRGWLEEGNELFGTAVTHLRQLREQTPLTVDDNLWGKMLVREGQFLYRLGRYNNARLLLEESLAIFRRLHMQRETVFTLNLLGRIAYRQGLYDESEQWCQESLALCQTIPFAGGMVSALGTLGHVAADRGEYDKARHYYQEGLDICERIGDQHNKARRLNELGNIYWRLGDYAQAKKLCRQSLALFQKLDDRQGIAMTFKNLGNIAGDSGEYNQAENWYRQGLTLCQEIGDRWGEAALSNNLGNIYWQAGRYDEARQLCEQSVTAWREFGFQWGIAGSLETLANIAIAQDVLADAKAYIREALIIGHDIQATPLVLDVLVSLAQLWGREDKPAQAQELLTFVKDQPAMDQEGRIKTEAAYHEIAGKTAPGSYVIKWQTLDEVVTAVLQKIDSP